MAKHYFWYVLREHTTNKPKLQEMLKEILWIKGRWYQIQIHICKNEWRTPK